ncbi:MAG: YncE family protein, partial [Nitrososphaerota archaeon]|nr:YncE family protein [Nitrososphaerota archaeon]
MTLRGGSWAEVVLIVVLVVVMVVPPGAVAHTNNPAGQQGTRTFPASSAASVVSHGTLNPKRPSATPAKQGSDSIPGARSPAFPAQTVPSCSVPPCEVTNVTGLGPNSMGVAYDAGKQEMYVTNPTAGNITVVSIPTNQVVKVISDPLADPYGVAYDSAKGEIFVTNQAGTVSIINDSSNSFVANVTVGTQPSSACYDRAKGEVYVVNVHDQTVSVINDTTNTVVTTIPYPIGLPLDGAFPNTIAYDAQKGEIFVSTGTWEDVVNDTNNSVVSTIYTGGSDATLYDSGRSEVFVSNTNGVVVISALSNKVVATLPFTGIYRLPDMAYDPEMGDIYVAANPTNNMSVISDSTNTVVAHIDMNLGNTLGMAYAPSTGEVYVANGEFNPVNSGNMTVISPLAIRLQPSAIDLGDPITLKAVPISPAPALSYAETGLPLGCNSIDNPTLNCTPTTAGTFTIHTYANDSNGTASRLSTLVVNPDLTLTSFAASPNATDVGNSSTLQVAFTGGTANFSFAYTGLPTGCASADVSSLVCDPSQSGNFSVRVYVNDSAGASVNATLTLHVATHLSILGFTVTPNLITLGTAVNFQATVSGGQPPYVYSYRGLPRGCSSVDNVSLSCTPTLSGSYTPVFTVQDASSVNQTMSISLMVDTRPSVTLSVGQTQVDVNQTVRFLATVTGGAGPFTFQYSPSSAISGCASATTSELNCTPTSVGTFTVTVNVTDSLGAGSQFTSTTIAVSPAIKTTLTVSSATPLLAQTVAVVANASGGRAPYNYTYLGLPYGCYSKNISSIGCLPTQSGWYNITVVVRDLNNATATATVAMHVIFDFNVVVPASTPVGKQLTIMVNTNETFNGTAINASALFAPDGGYGAFTYNYSGLPPGCVNKDVATLTCT